MEQQLKQRLVGVTVIFSLAVIFLPMLLDGSGNRPKHLKISIPIPPEVPSYEIVDDKVAKLKLEAAKLSQIETVMVDEIGDPDMETKEKAHTIPPQKDESIPVVIEEKKTKPVVKKVDPVLPKTKVTKTKQSPKKQVGGDSWVIQVGSFSEKNKAFKQRDKLRKSGMAAVFIEKFKHDKGVSYRVRMGPFISREKAEVIKNKVRAKYNIKGLIMGYEK